MKGNYYGNINLPMVDVQVAEFVWALANRSSTHRVIIREIHLWLSFSAAASAGNEFGFLLTHITGLTGAMTSGDNVAVGKRSSEVGASVLAVADVKRELDTGGVLVTGGSVASSLVTALVPRTPPGSIYVPVIFDKGRELVLSTNEAFALQNAVTSVAGDNGSGYVTWDEEKI